MIKIGHKCNKTLKGDSVGCLWERSIGMNCEVKCHDQSVRSAIKITEESVEEIVTVLAVKNSVGWRKITGRSNIATGKMEFVFVRTRETELCE